MARRDDTIAIMIDAKNEMKRSIGDLDGRIGELDRELRTALTNGLAGLRDGEFPPLRSSQLETRTSANKAAQKAGEAITAVTDLRRDLDRLHAGMADLRAEVGDVLDLLREQAASRAEMAAVPAQTPAPAPEYAHAAAVSGNEAPGALLPGQRAAHDTESLAAGTAQMTEAGQAKDLPDALTHQGGDEGDEEQGQEQVDEAPAVENTIQTPLASDATCTNDQETDLTQAAVDALDSERSPREPYPLSDSGRVWAIMRASQVGQATLVCHRDAWEFISEQTSSHPHFHAPTMKEDRGDGLTSGTLSGRSLVAVLLSLYHLSQTALKANGVDDIVGQADWALASQLYTAIARGVSNLRAGEGEPVLITVDHRAPAGHAG